MPPPQLAPGTTRLHAVPFDMSTRGELIVRMLSLPLALVTLLAATQGAFAQPVPPAEYQHLARDIFKQLIEIDTTHDEVAFLGTRCELSLIHISEPTRLL